MVISRRALLAGAVAAGGIVTLEATDTFDDVLRAAGVTPRPRPRDSDISLVQAVLEDQQRLLGIALGADGADAAVALLSAQVTQLGGTPTTAPRQGDLYAALQTAAAHRAADASGAVAADVAMVFASMSAGLAQLAARPAGGGA